MAGHDVFHHIRDSKSFEVPRFLSESGHIEIPQIFGEHFALTKFMVLETVALVLAILIFVPLAIKIRRGEPVRGAFWNFWESIVLFLRDELVRPLIGDGHHDDHGHEAHGHEGHAHGDHGHAAPVAHGAHASVTHGEGGAGHGGGALLAADGGGSVTATIDHLHAAQVVASHPADKYLPFILSAFFFILFNNLLGAIPFLGSATGNIWVTGVLAVTTLAYVIMVGTKELGVGGFWVNLVPSMGLSGPIKYPIVGLMWVIEFAGLLIKHGVLAVRLFANIMAGHTVIAVILGFIALAGNSPLFYVVAPASVLGQVGIGLLELFVAFLQAYVFAFLATLFIGAAVHPH